MRERASDAKECWILNGEKAGAGVRGEGLGQGLGKNSDVPLLVGVPPTVPPTCSRHRQA